MSLDISLHSKEEHQVICPYCDQPHMEKKCYYDANITHNLGSMADAAGIYQWLWRPNELGVTSASELISPLTNGLSRLKAYPEHFKTFNPSNGWGDYDVFVSFVKGVLNACIDYPDAEVYTSI